MTTAALARNKASVTRITAETVPAQAFADLVNGARLYELWTRLAFHDIRQRFRRSVLGPFWLTLSMGIFVAALGLVFSTLFHQDVAKTLPYIATGVIFWGLLTSCINEGTTVFIVAESFIRNVPTPLSIHFYRMMARNVMIWGFNMAIYVVVVGYFGPLPGWNVVPFIPGFILFLINVSWISLAAGVLSTRYRDIPQVIANVIQVIFFVTPIFWSLETLPNRPAFVVFNPFYHLIEIVRAPLLGEAAPAMSWGLCIGIALVGCGFTAWLYRRAHAGALLDSTAGMDPESTGLENIYLRGYMMGMSRREIASKFDEIAEFTELGDFLALPMRTYSAGMFARLAFAVSTAAQNDILLIDEGIGAGDAAFREKARQRIESLFNRTPIVILASHSEALISEFCSRRVQLEHGVLKGAA